MSNLHLHRVVSDVCGWEGRCGMLHEAIREDFSDLKPLHIYASGSPSMVYGTLDALVAAGMDPHQMRADVFAYAPGKAERSLPLTENAGHARRFIVSALAVAAAVDSCSRWRPASSAQRLAARGCRTPTSTRYQGSSRTLTLSTRTSWPSRMICARTRSASACWRNEPACRKNCVTGALATVGGGGGT